MWHGVNSPWRIHWKTKKITPPLPEISSFHSGSTEDKDIFTTALEQNGKPM